MISFRLNRKNDNELILLLSKYENNMSEFIRCALRNNLLTSKDITEDPFINSKSASNTDNVEVRNINKKTEINKSKSIKWDNPKLK